VVEKYGRIAFVPEALPLAPRADSGRDAALGYHLDQVAGAQFKRQVPPRAQDNEVPIEVPSLQELLR
jgi:hypothetical protein